MINKKGQVAKEVLMVLIAVVFTSAIVFGLVKVGVVEVDSNQQDSLLNTEFIPYDREGTVIIENFRFCDLVGSLSNCDDERAYFYHGEQVHFFFDVYSSPYQGDLLLVENYRIVGPHGNVLLEVEQENDHHFSVKSDEDLQVVHFKDYFVVSSSDPLGEYTFQLLVNNPILNKQVTLSKTFEVMQ